MKGWLAIILVTGSMSTSLTKIRRDTYLTAYMESHGPGSLPPGEVYGAPSSDYGAPSTGYGTPSTGYGAPSTGYGPPAGEPHSVPSNPLDPIHAKIVLLFKVLLKLLIFKLIVKFIAIICVLFFLPKLTELGVAKEEARRITEKVPEDNSLDLTQFVLGAISGSPTTRVCRSEASPICGLYRRIRELDTRISVQRLFKEYLREEQGKLRKQHTRQSH